MTDRPNTVKPTKAGIIILCSYATYIKPAGRCSGRNADEETVISLCAKRAACSDVEFSLFALVFGYLLQANGPGTRSILSSKEKHFYE